MSEVTRTQVRIPSEIWNWIKDSGRKNERSANGELVRVLAKIKKQQEEKQAA